MGKKKKKLNKHFNKEGKYMKRCSTSLVIRDMKIKTTVRYYYITIKMAQVKKSDNA